MNVLIIGLGSIARKHIEALKNNYCDVRLYALRHNKNASPEEGITNIFSIGDVPGSIDIAIISNPTANHYQTIQDCLKLKCPLFIEKPLFSKSEDFNTLHKTIEEYQIKTYVACVLRFHPVIKYLKKLLREKASPINEVNIYCGSYLPDWRKGVDFRNSYSSRKELGGGVHLDLIHEIDYACYLFGKPQQVIKTTRSGSTLKINSCDYANFCLIYDSFAINIILNYYRVDPKREIEILFQDQTIKGDLLNSTITNNLGENLFSGSLEMQQLYDEQMNYFCTHDEPMNQIEEAWEVLKLVL